MKKLILFCLVLLTSVSLFAQEVEMITAREAYDYLNKEKTFENYDLAWIMGMEAGVGTQLDFYEGKSTFWAFVCKSKDTTDRLAHIFIPLKMGEVWDKIYQTDDQSDYQMLASLPNPNWVNSSEIGKEIKNNQQFVNYLKMYENEIQAKQMNLMYGESPVPGSGEILMVWSTTAYVADNNIAICFYNGTDGNPLLCNIPPVTSILSNKIKDLLYPNPTIGKITLKNDIQDKSTVLIYDVNGIIVMKLEDVVPSNLNLDLSKLTNGQYTVVILSNDKMTSQKVIIFK